MKKRTKALAISPKVRSAVYERDGWCVWCGCIGFPEAHYIPRSQGGLGIEENILTLCRRCHYRFDHGPDRKKMKEYLKAYLKTKYPEWDESKLTYRREKC